MALMDVYKVICIPMAAFYFLTVYLLLGKKNLSKVFKHTNFDLLRFGMLMLFYNFVSIAFFYRPNVSYYRSLTEAAIPCPSLYGHWRPYYCLWHLHTNSQTLYSRDPADY